MAALRLARGNTNWLEANLSLGILGRFEILIPHRDGIILIFIRRDWLNRLKIGRYRFGKLTIVVHYCYNLYPNRIQLMEHSLEMLILIFAIIFAYKLAFDFVKNLAKCAF
jgi:hypothetical protein